MTNQPRVRKLIHRERKKEVTHSTTAYDKAAIDDSEPVFHGSNHVSALQDPKYKENLIKYLSSAFLQMAVNLSPGLTFILDSPSLGDTPVAVTSETITKVRYRQNIKGEADNAVWLHASKSEQPAVIIVANDTDIWLYGLALFEADWLKYHESNKLVAVERETGKDYISINTGVECVKQKLSHLVPSKTASTAILAIYLLGGSDYISNFFNISYKRLLQALCQYTHHISMQEDPLIRMRVHTDGSSAVESISLTLHSCD